MNFRTILPLQPSDAQLRHSDKVMVLGSCFSENIGSFLIEGGFRVSLNPFGVLYNPASVGTALLRMWRNEPFRQEELVEHDGFFHSFSHHGSFSGTDPKKTLEKMNASFHRSVQDLSQATWLMITFGTAWVYALPSSDQIVANCHKFPENCFLRRRLSVDEVVCFYTDLLDVLFQAKPNLNVLFTVSPIRHVKDGFHENTLSKSVLHLAVAELCACFEQVFYFPAYELLTDDLRDYRFYADDMVHPSLMAQQYIRDRFSEIFFHRQTGEVVRQVRQIRKAAEHRPFHPNSEAYKRFAKKNIAAIELLSAMVPELDLSREKAVFEQTKG